MQEEGGEGRLEDSCPHTGIVNIPCHSGEKIVLSLTPVCCGCSICYSAHALCTFHHNCLVVTQVVEGPQE